ncbi:MAG: ATP-binding protein [Cyclobacteriaceae bacterium]
MRGFGLVLSLISILNIAHAEGDPVVLSTQMFQSHGRIFLAPLDGWVFKQGNDPGWADPQLKVDDWQRLNPTEINAGMEDASGRIEGWFRIKVKLDQSFKNIPLAINRDLWAATDVYVDGELVHAFGDTGNPYRAFNPILKYPVPVDLIPGKEHLIAIHFVDYETTFTQREIRLKPENLQRFINLAGPEYTERVTRDIKLTHIYVTICVSISFLLFFLFWLLVFLNPGQKIFSLFARYTSFVLIGALFIFGNTFFEISYSLEKVRFIIMVTTQAVMTIFGLFILEWVLTQKISRNSWTILGVILVTNILAHVFSISFPFGIAFTGMLIYFGRIVFKHRKNIRGAQWTIVAGIILPTLAIVGYITLHKYSLDLFNEYDKLILSMTILSPPFFLMAYISVRFKEILKEVKDEAQKVLKVTEEKKEILSNQNIMLEKQVDERTQELKQSLETLKSTQSQLIQSEKMASLGELTAGIAHEIQNPLNFVNNFSEVNKELITELKTEVKKGNLNEVELLANDIEANEEKINHHGKRADAIVKGMLQHSRSSSGVKEPTDINALCDEYLRLGYHGLRAKDKSFNATMKTEFDNSLEKINIIPQDIGRVVLNLITNAFYAVTEKKKGAEGYEPTVTVSTKQDGTKVLISVKDNGNGIPGNIRKKIFQPFFTTKPTGQGTGLGLSLSYDIVKAHGGELTVETEEGEGSEFVIHLPLV